MTAAQYVLDSPNAYMDSDNPKRPVRTTGLRPTRSDKRLQCKTVKASIAKNIEC